MPRLKRVILLLALISALCVGVAFLPIILILFGDMVGKVVNRPFSLCKVMDRTQLEAALSNGLNLNAGCCVEHMIGECSIARANSSELIFAIENKALDAVKLLLEHGADVNKSTESGYAISTAASQGSKEIVEALLAYEINPESRDIALRMAAHYGHTEVAELILDREAPENRGASCAKLACSLVTDLDQIDSPHVTAQKKLFLYIISNCLDPNISCEGAGRILGHAAKKDAHAPIIKALLEHGADPNAKEANGKTVRENLRNFWDYDSRPQIKALIENK